MSFIAGILTFLIVVNCLVLIFLVLIQLPKKDTGAGVAFGGGAADALFGAGSGNILTKITKWSAGIFFGLALLLGFVDNQLHKSNAASFEQGVAKQQTQAPTQAVSPAPAAPPASPASTNLQLALPLVTTAPAPANAGKPPASTKP